MTTGRVMLPTDTGENVWWRFVLGAGFMTLLDDQSEFESNNGALRMTIDSAFRAVALGGIGFKLSRRADIVLFLQVAQGGAVGVVLGTSMKITDNIGVMVGLSSVRGKELAAGFRRAAAEVVKRERSNPASPFARFRLNGTETALLDEEEYDGFR